jgi:hypothetical protein
MDDDEWKQNNSSEENENEAEDIDQTEKESSGGVNEYETRRAKNIAELKLAMDKLKETYPVPEDLVAKPVLKKPAAKKEKEQPVNRRASARNKPADNERYADN